MTGVLRSKGGEAQRFRIRDKHQMKRKCCKWYLYRSRRAKDCWQHQKLKEKHVFYLCVCSVRVWLFPTPWTVAHKAPLPMEFFRQGSGEGCHFLLQRIFPAQGSNPSCISCIGRWVLYHSATWEAVKQDIEQIIPYSFQRKHDILISDLQTLELWKNKLLGSF